MIYEHFAFRSARVAPAPALAVHDPQSCVGGAGAGGVAFGEDDAEAAAADAALAAAQRARCALVLDVGFSYSHAVPLFDARVQLAGVRRINIGGKALTNHLKELVSYRCASTAHRRPPSESSFLNLLALLA